MQATTRIEYCENNYGEYGIKSVSREEKNTSGQTIDTEKKQNMSGRVGKDMEYRGKFVGEKTL